MGSVLATSTVVEHAAARAALANEWRNMKKQLLILMIVLSAFAGGCNSWGRVAPKGKVRNALVEADIRKNLLADRITGFEVEVYEDGTAYLKGHVKNRSDREKAKEDALKVFGVKRVVNDISIEP